jgi:hypothetical protein
MAKDMGPTFALNFHILPSSVPILEMLFLVIISILLQAQGS